MFVPSAPKMLTRIPAMYFPMISRPIPRMKIAVVARMVSTLSRRKKMTEGMRVKST